MDVYDIFGNKLDIPDSFGDVAKSNLLDVIKHISIWDDGNAKDRYDALESSLFESSYPKITAIYNGQQNVFTDDSIDALKESISVTYYASKEDTGALIDKTKFDVSGKLTKGTSKLTVKYGNTSTVVSIPNVIDFYNIWEWDSNSTGANVLNKMPFASMEKSVNNVKRGILYANSNTTNNRRTFVVSRGKAPEIGMDNVATDVYPIPIPNGATKLTATITPSTQQFASYVFKYEGSVDENGFNYLMVAPDSISWKTGTDVITFEASENLFVAFNCRKNASNETYTDDTEPTMHILFE